MARGLLASVAALALAPVVAASRPLPVSSYGPGGTSFDEVYRGRRIQGYLVPVAGRKRVDGDWEITVDGRLLHLMRRADGSWMSMIDHYTSYRTPLEATRAAVDEIGPGQRLLDLAPGPVGGEPMGGQPMDGQPMDGQPMGGHAGMRMDESVTGSAGGGYGVRA
ncbi:tyrosinase family oxidase copper chaperone [Streptomyces sp. NPDC048297]|uniref:tyrosinase family oxidase copper chaperone n=1 Tax=Streptomyces sp. NPDC048297 TaxID=3365531 RepID=UPI003721A411